MVPVAGRGNIGRLAGVGNPSREGLEAARRSATLEPEGGEMPEPASGTDRAARPLEAGSERILEITDLAFGGRGVARLEGFVIFVAGALPGESVGAGGGRGRGGIPGGACR